MQRDKTQNFKIQRKNRRKILRPEERGEKQEWGFQDEDEGENRDSQNKATKKEKERETTVERGKSRKGNSRERRWKRQWAVGKTKRQRAKEGFEGFFGKELYKKYPVGKERRANPTSQQFEF